MYHCVSRCVRRAYLCGYDKASGRSFDHRKDWIETRILELAEIFAVAVHAYAVMSNHYHLVVEIDPPATHRWSDDEVARRWIRLSRPSPMSDSQLESRVAVLTEQSDLLEILRQRLGSLSWFMRCLNEPIARRANREDDCTGRFWEGRFKCQALLDDSAVLGSMVYVDLNPIRAGVAETPETSKHTSVRRRASSSCLQYQPMQPVAACIGSTAVEMSTEQYLALVDWTGRWLHAGKRGAIPTDLVPILERLKMRPHQWLMQVPATESRYWRAIGTKEALVAKAYGSGLKWIKGIGTARIMLRFAQSAWPL